MNRILTGQRISDQQGFMGVDRLFDLAQFTHQCFINR